MLIGPAVVYEQNANQLAGVQVDTSVYVGTGVGGVPTLRVGREAPVYVIEGVQTAAVVDIILETANAYAGASFNIRLGTGASGTSTIRLINATTGGTVVSTATGGNVLGNQKNLIATFNGVAWK